MTPNCFGAVDVSCCRGQSPEGRGQGACGFAFDAVARPGARPGRCRGTAPGPGQGATLAGKGALMCGLVGSLKLGHLGWKETFLVCWWLILSRFGVLTFLDCSKFDPGSSGVDLMVGSTDTSFKNLDERIITSKILEGCISYQPVHPRFNCNSCILDNTSFPSPFSTVLVPSCRFPFPRPGAEARGDDDPGEAPRGAAAADSGRADARCWRMDHGCPTAGADAVRWFPVGLKIWLHGTVHQSFVGSEKLLAKNVQYLSIPTARFGGLRLRRVETQHTTETLIQVSVIFGSDRGEPQRSHMAVTGPPEPPWKRSVETVKRGLTDGPTTNLQSPFAELRGFKQLLACAFSPSFHS